MSAEVATSRTVRWVAVVAVGAVAIAGCSTQEDASPETAASTTPAPTTTTTVPVTTTTTTTVPPTTTTTTTVAPTTTVPPPSGVPTNGAVPVFAGGADDAWLYVGRWTGSEWEGAFDADGAPIEPALATNATVTVRDLARGERDGTGGALGETCFDGRVGPTITPNGGAPDVPGRGYGAIALQADWSLVPRPVGSVDAAVPAYAEAGVTAFAGDDVETQAGEIDQIVVADLDGDGDSESLVVFGDESESEGSVVDPGFSGLLLIDADTGASTIVIKDFIPLSAAQPTTTTTDPATGEPGDAPAPPTFETYRVLDVADLNGDGLMEIVVHVWDDDGEGITIFTYDGDDVSRAIETGCGV